ncbi:NEDD8-activating enzyme E1 regulatory subunit [Venustampulla echinocandica]|uniref:NEDD8-activating enzyme E1 regulatory subunit n=1 Tax=Venustampulla echinocandica TaxID=2656787 RepID=A0A370T8N2_9HELO|nr:NEDD8-activating enzyme E1 regulatory subunit [Venustampulla echinocandica]RDL29721.1 NEDD8-activating enzyme E1 regulatory subunit [Venustampulla echinocandica]
MTDIIIDQTPPILHNPSDKEKKYDRQLRLWAASGQQALEDAHILLLNSGSGAVGIETLKNLVLPGIGKFTIADEAIVDEADLGVNFFLEESSLGKLRSECCTKLLQELNPDVKGDWFPHEQGETLEHLFGSEQRFTLIMYTLPIEPKKVDLIHKHASKHKIPVISIHSAGFYSYFRIRLPGNFPIVETHPDSTATTDLRLLTPWPELLQFTESLTENIENQSALEHGHIPYVALLLHYLGKWKDIHGSLPATYKEKTAFRDTVAAGARRDNPEGGEENFDEAVAAVLKTTSLPTLPSSVKEVFDYSPSDVRIGTQITREPMLMDYQNQMEASSSFWIIAGAVKQFYTKHGALPLAGSVPDMKAQSTVYVKLQNIYKAKARQDAAEVLKIVRTHPSGKDIPEAEVETFCKNAAFIKVIRGTDTAPLNIQDIANKEFDSDENAALASMPLSLFPIYISLNATSHVAFASSSDILTAISKSIPNAASNSRLVQAAEEVARAKGGELHNISALTGGMAAQEVIKIITKQYIPIDNTCVFDELLDLEAVMRRILEMKGRESYIGGGVAGPDILRSTASA